jgi:hypothetical protein
MKALVWAVIVAAAYAQWVRMEPSVKLFSSAHWTLDVLRASKEETTIDVVFALKVCP